MFSSDYSDMPYRPDYFYSYDDPLLRAPKRIGNVQAGYINRRRLNRMLPEGHRWRGDVGI